MSPRVDKESDSRLPAGRGDRRSDEQVVGRILSGDAPQFAVIMRRYNQRLFRTVRAMLPSDEQAEQTLQETFVRAYHSLGQLTRRIRLSTWLTRLAVHEVLAQRRRERRFKGLDDSHGGWRHESDVGPRGSAGSPERVIRHMPESLRLTFLLCEADGLDADEAAACLGISTANVKVRLHQARSLLRSAVGRPSGTEARRLHRLTAARGESIVARVMSRIR